MSDYLKVKAIDKHKESMVGKEITGPQRDTITKIENVLGTRFHGLDRYDAYLFIGNYIEEYKRKKPKAKRGVVNTDMPFKKDNHLCDCYNCNKPLFEDDMVFWDTRQGVNQHQKNICSSCYNSPGFENGNTHPPETLPLDFCHDCNTKLHTHDEIENIAYEEHDGEEFEITCCKACAYKRLKAAELLDEGQEIMRFKYEINGVVLIRECTKEEYTRTCKECYGIKESVHALVEYKGNKICAHCYDQEIKKAVDSKVKSKTESLEIKEVHCTLCNTHLHEHEIYYKPFSTGKGMHKLCADCYESVASTDEAIKNTGAETPTKPKKRGNSMFANMKSILGEIGKVTTEQFKLSFQGVAIRTEKPTAGTDASYAVYNPLENRMVDVMDFVLDVENVFYKIPVALNQLKQGDIIIAKDKPLVVKSVDEKKFSIRALNPITNNETTYKPAGNLFGFQFITKVVSMFDMMQPGQQMNPMMMLAFAGDNDGDSKFGDLLPLMMMGGMNGQAGANPMQNMLPFLMMSGKGGDSSMMEMMMMSQMMGGGFGGFGQQPAQQGFGFQNFFNTQAPVTEEELVDGNTEDK